MALATDAGVASPHTRGWTLDQLADRSAGAGFPAHAGMDRSEELQLQGRQRLPRTRGDGPGSGPLPMGLSWASPHTRGWTVLKVPRVDAGTGFPAHAGMDPALHRCTRSARGLPRTRGDGPVYPLGRARAVTASPHTRGWTCRAGDSAAGGRGFPAHAGMDPPARSSVSLLIGLPRTRGDGPSRNSAGMFGMSASPHTRGWTRATTARPPPAGGFPAHAGMDRDDLPLRVGWRRLPRTRGDGPR